MSLQVNRFHCFYFKTNKTFEVFSLNLKYNGYPKIINILFY